MPGYTFLQATEVLIRGETTDGYAWRLRSEEVTESDITVSVESSRDGQTIGMAVFKSNEDTPFEIVMYSGTKELVLRGKGLGDAREVSMEFGVSTYELVLRADGTFDPEPLMRLQDVTIPKEFEPVAVSIGALRRPVTQALPLLIDGRPSGPIIVFQSSSTNPTKEECDAKYINTMKSIGAQAIINAGTAVACGVAGLPGLIAGLVILGGTYIDTEAKEDQAKEDHTNCVENAPA